MNKEIAKIYKNASIINIRNGSGKYSTILYAEIESEDGDLMYSSIFQDCVDMMLEAAKYWEN